ncbi:MAG: hypothetical protein ACREA0_24675 [bacterium]
MYRYNAPLVMVVLAPGLVIGTGAPTLGPGYAEKVNLAGPNEQGQDRSVSPVAIRLAAAACLLVAFGVFVLMALIAPDAGPTPTSFRQGVALAVVSAAAPIAAFVSPVDGASLVALGGGMTMAGAATTPGGNLLGPIMMAFGVLLLLVGRSHQPSLTPGLIGRLLLFAVALAAGVWLAIDTGMLTGLAALVLAGGIAISTRLSTSASHTKPSADVPICARHEMLVIHA